MKLEPGKFCPLIKKDCIGLQCSWFIQVRGTNPQNGQEVDEWACAVAWQPLLQIETTQQMRQGAAATESMRNEVVACLRAVAQTQMAAATLVSGAGKMSLENNDAAN